MAGRLKLSVPLRHDAPFDCGGRALAMFYHTVVLESGDVVIALEADSNRSPLEKGSSLAINPFGGLRRSIKRGVGPFPSPGPWGSTME